MNLECLRKIVQDNGKRWLFHALLLAPLIWHLIEDRPWTLYGFTALFISARTLFSEKLVVRLGRNNAIGALFILFSFLTPFLKPLYGIEARYTSLEYAFHFFGLLVLFYGFSTVRHFLSSMCFLVTVSLFSHFWWALTPYFYHLVPVTVYIVTGLLNLSGMATSFQGDLIIISGSRSLTVLIAPECAGVFSIFIFSLVILVLFSQTRGPLMWKVGWAATGFIGTFLMNCLRIYLIIMVGVYWPKTMDLFHRFIGYFLFIAWILLFEYAALNSFQPASKLPQRLKR